MIRRHPDADALMTGVLANPADPLPRLVLADWLEETDVPANVTWAHFLRARQQLAECRETDHVGIGVLKKRIRELTPHIRAKLTLPAAYFVRHAFPLLRVLPAARFTVDLDEFAVEPETIGLLPECIGRENVVFPLSHTDNFLFVAIHNPSCAETMSKLEFILNRHIVGVLAEGDQIRAALDRHFGDTEVEYIECPFLEPVRRLDPVPETGP